MTPRKLKTRSLGVVDMTKYKRNKIIDSILYWLRILVIVLAALFFSIYYQGCEYKNSEQLKREIRL